MIRIGYAPDAFDLFHVGHLNLLRSARSCCDYLIAGVVSEEMLKVDKGITPVGSLEERLEIVRSIGFVDKAVAEVVPHKIDMWRQLQFDAFSSRAMTGRASMRELGSTAISPPSVSRSFTSLACRAPRARRCVPRFATAIRSASGSSA